MGFFWPRYEVAEPTASARLGRVAHWIGLIIGAPFLLFLTAPFWEGNDPALALFALGGAVPALIGRGLRYVLANE